MRDFNDPPLAELVEDIRDHRVVCFVGTGVTIGAVYPMQRGIATWTGLLEDGVTRSVQEKRARWRWGRDKDAWAKSAREEIAGRTVGGFLSVASDIAKVLRAPDEPFSNWLAESVGRLRVRDGAVLKALDGLDTIILTTNYDDLLTIATGRTAATWADKALVQKILQDERKGILHVHGCWSRPDMVVLARNQYERVVKDPFAQGALQSLRTMKKLLFVGFGQGLDDPNFTQFFEWSQRIFEGCERACYKLVLESEASSASAIPTPSEDQIRLVSYGHRHEDLAQFLTDLRRAAWPPRRAREPASLPTRPLVIGREREIDAVTTAITRRPFLPTLVRGPVAIGKTSILLAAMHDQRTVSTFAERRYFVGCDGARSYDLLLTEIARIIGAMRSTSSVEEHVLAHFDSGPALLAFDRFEVPWRADQAACGTLLKLLRDKSELSLAISLDGEQPIPALAQAQSFSVLPLALEDGRALFLRIAGSEYETDGYLIPLLKALDGMPLAIELIANLSRGELNLKGVWRRWVTESAALLQKDAAPGPLALFSVSLETALNYAELSGHASELLAALSLLPTGVAHEDVEAVVDSSARAAAELRQRGLAVQEPGRIRLLAPVRECIRNRHFPDGGIHARLVDHLVALAEDNGRLVRRHGGKAGIARLAREMANFEAVFDTHGSDNSDAHVGTVALQLSDFVQHTGLGSTRLLRRAIRATKTPAAAKARCHVRLGDLLLSTCDDVEGSANHFAEALKIYQQLGHERDIGDCVIRLGDVQLAEDHPPMAEALYRQALKLAEKMKDPFNEADCIVRLGDLSLRRRAYRAARRLYGKAARIYARLADEGGSTGFALRVQARRALGRAMCLQRLAVVAERSGKLRRSSDLLRGAYHLCERSGFTASQADTALALGDVALELEELTEAKHWYDDARTLYASFGASSGQAESERRSAAVIFSDGKFGPAKLQCEHALQIFRETGDLTGEGGCLADLGAIAHASADNTTAHKLWTQALGLFERVPDHYWLALIHERLAEMSSGADREKHEFCARKGWSQFMDARECIPKRARAGMWASFIERRRNPWVVAVLPASSTHNRRRTSESAVPIRAQIH